MAFDAGGRLWITQSREYPFAAPLDNPHGIKSRSFRISMRMDVPERSQPSLKASTFHWFVPLQKRCDRVQHSVYYFFQDTDGDGHADKQEMILADSDSKRTFTVLTSAFRRGFDGWIYADHGYNNDTTLVAKDGSSIR